VSSQSKPSIELSAADITALRWLAVAWGGIIATTWLVIDNARLQLLMTAAQLAILAATLGTIYLLRRWRNRRGSRPG
jgi:Flp pilus assembly protein TadB